MRLEEDEGNVFGAGAGRPHEHSASLDAISYYLGSSQPINTNHATQRDFNGLSS